MNSDSANESLTESLTERPLKSKPKSNTTPGVEQVSDDPPSLALSVYEIPENQMTTQQQDSLNKADARRIRAEIQRLKLKLESIESLDSE